MLEQSVDPKLFDELIQNGSEKTHFFSEIDIFKHDSQLQEKEKKHVQIVKSILGSNRINWSDLDFPGPNSQEDSKLLEVSQKLSQQLGLESADIYAALTCPLITLSYPNNPYLSEAFYPDWVTVVSLMRERMSEEGEKIKDKKLVPQIVSHLTTIFGFELSMPVHMRYSLSAIIGYSLIDSGDHVYHTVNMRKGTISSAEDLGVKGGKDQVESIYRLMVLIHELAHAYTTEVLNPQLSTLVNGNQPDTLVGIIQEGISTMAERELLLTLIDMLREKAPKLAEICFALLKREISYKPSNHYQKGFEVFRKLRSNNFKEVLELVRKIGVEELSKYSINDAEYSRFIQNPLNWLQNYHSLHE